MAMRVRAWCCLAAVLLLDVPAGAQMEHVHGRTVATPFERMMTEAMDTMDHGMSVAPTGDSDADFARMMIPHHQGAIDMAKAELQFGRNPVLRRLAQGIIVEQQQEIELMRRELKRLSPPRSP